jgi:hypothetical protein
MTSLTSTVFNFDLGFHQYALNPKDLCGQRQFWKQWANLKLMYLNCSLNRTVLCLQQNLNAARSCFLPKAEKQELIAELMKVYGLDEMEDTLH